MCTYKREGGREGRVLQSVSLIYTCICFLYYRKEKNLEVSFDVPQLCHPSQGMWHHLLVTIQAKGLRGKAKANVYVDGKSVGNSQKVRYIHIQFTHNCFKIIFI